MTAIINTTTNATEWFYRIPQLCTSHNIWGLATGITGFCSSAVGVFGLFSTRPILSNKSFKSMMNDIYNERHANNRELRDEQAQEFLIFSLGRYFNYFNANGPFNEEACRRVYLACRDYYRISQKQLSLKLTEVHIEPPKKSIWDALTSCFSTHTGAATDRSAVYRADKAENGGETAALLPKKRV